MGHTMCPWSRPPPCHPASQDAPEHPDVRRRGRDGPPPGARVAGSARRRDGLLAPAPWPGRRGAARRRRDRARPPPPLDHRPLLRRASADGELGRIGLDHLQRRDLQLRRAARGAHRRSATSSGPRRDTEVLLAAYDAWGRRCSSASTACSRSRCGTGESETLLLRPRPLRRQAALLHSRRRGGCASPPRSRRCWSIPAVPRRPNDARVLDFLAHGLSDHTEETMFDGILQLRPGTLPRATAVRAGPGADGLVPAAAGAPSRPAGRRAICAACSRAPCRSGSAATSRSASRSPAAWTRRRCWRWRASCARETGLEPPRTFTRALRRPRAPTSTATRRASCGRPARRTPTCSRPPTDCSPSSTHSSGTWTSRSTARASTASGRSTSSPGRAA